MQIKLQMLGTGSAFAKKYFNNNALIYADCYTLLLDCGITAPLALHKLNISPGQLDGIMITHLHGDHIGGLEELAFLMKFVYNKKPDLFVPEKLVGPLWEHSLRGGLEQAGISEGLDDFFQVIPLIEQQEHTVQDDLKLEILPTEHIPGKPSYAVILNGFVYYSADSKFSKAQLEYIHSIKRCQVILHDCQLQPPATVHATLDELLTLPVEIQSPTWRIFAIKPDRFMEQHHIYQFYQG